MHVKASGLMCPYLRQRGFEVALKAVDINCDMGEAFGRWSIGDARDSAIMGLISSANIAAGFHAGDPNLMDDTVRLAVQHGVGIGAHPGYRDLQGFGRRKIAGSAKELVNDVVYQVGALREFARRYGASVQHVKPHGALYMEMAVNAELSGVFIDYMRQAAPGSFVFCMPGSATDVAARAAGQPAVREFYVDRDYDDTGSIVFVRDATRPDPSALAEKALRACVDGKVRTIAGNDLDVEFESLCIHSDTPGAEAILTRTREALVGAGIRIAPVSELVPT